VENYLDGKKATSESFSGIKFDLNTGAIENTYTSTITPVVTTTIGDGSATSKINRAGQLYKSSAGTITLTRGSDENAWTVTNNGGYPNMTLDLATAGVDDSVAIDLDGAGGADITFTLTGAWADTDTMEFDIVQTEATPADGIVRFYPIGGSTLTGDKASNTFADLNVTVGEAGAVGNNVTVAITDTAIKATETFNTDLIVTAGAGGAVGNNVTVAITDGGPGAVLAVAGGGTDAITVTFDSANAAHNNAAIAALLDGTATATAGTLSVTGGATDAAAQAATNLAGGAAGGAALAVAGGGTDAITVTIDSANAAHTNAAIAALLNGIATATAGELSVTGGATLAAAQAATALVGGIDGTVIGTNGAGDITWNMAGDDAPKINSYASASSITLQNQDGYKKGDLTSLDVNKSGIVEGMFSNGKRQKLAMILLATFRNINGLNKIGSYFSETAESGKVNPAKPATAGLGEIMASSLEMSNTDVAKEFIKMITAQRAYQSSARIITATDQMLQELMNIKR